MAAALLATLARGNWDRHLRVIEITRCDFALDIQGPDIATQGAKSIFAVLWALRRLSASAHPNQTVWYRPLSSQLDRRARWCAPPDWGQLALYRYA